MTQQSLFNAPRMLSLLDQRAIVTNSASQFGSSGLSSVCDVSSNSDGDNTCFLPFTTFAIDPARCATEHWTHLWPVIEYDVNFTKSLAGAGVSD